MPWDGKSTLVAKAIGATVTTWLIAEVAVRPNGKSLRNSWFFFLRNCIIVISHSKLKLFNPCRNIGGLRFIETKNKILIRLQAIAIGCCQRCCCNSSLILKSDTKLSPIKTLPFRLSLVTRELYSSQDISSISISRGLSWGEWGGDEETTSGKHTSPPWVEDVGGGGRRLLNRQRSSFSSRATLMEMMLCNLGLNCSEMARKKVNKIASGLAYGPCALYDCREREVKVIIKSYNGYFLEAAWKCNG